MSLPRLLVAGSLNMDFVVRVTHLPAPGQTVLGRDFVMVPGGKGANQAAAAGKLGAGRVSVQMAGRVGSDVFGGQLLQSLETHGVEVSPVLATGKQPTGTAFIWVDAGGQNSIVVAAGANGAFTPTDSVALQPHLRGCSWVLLQLETPLETVLAIALLARANGASTMLDPAPAQALTGELLRAVDLLTPNESEACLLLNRPVTRVTPAEAPDLAAALLATGPAAVVLKLGEQGCFYRDARESHYAPAPVVQAIDTTAAGDVFNGALAVALTEGRAIPNALRLANLAASISVTRLGAQTSIPARGEVDALLAVE